MAYYLSLAYIAVDYLQPSVKSAALGALRLNLTIGVLVIITGLLYTTSARKPVVFPRQSKLYLGLLVLMLLSTLTAVDNLVAWQRTFLALKYFPVYFVLTQVVDTPRKLRGLLYVFVAVHVWVAIDGIRAYRFAPQQGALEGVLSKFLGNTNDFALALVVIIPFALFLIPEAKSWLGKAALAGCVPLFVTGVMASLSRGGQLGVLTVFATAGLRSKRKTPVIVTLLCLVILLGLLAPQAYWDEVQSIADYRSDPSATGRLYAWSAAVKMALRNPLLGVGPSNFPTVYGRDFVAGRPEGMNAAWMTAHSVYFQILGELGFTGLAIFIAMTVTNLQTCRRLMREARTGQSARPSGDIVVAAAMACWTSVVGYLAAGTFLSATPQFYHLTGFIVATESVARLHSPSPSTPAGRPIPSAVAPVAMSATRRPSPGPVTPHA